MKDLLHKRDIIVLLGAGGVGKTTTSIAVAFAAAKLGRKVALLSIDPAKRLAAALGLTLGNQLRRIELPASLEATGTVDAAMLDQKAVFDAMVRKHAPNEAVEQRILAHPVYQAASTNMIGPLEYMALAKLQELSEDHRYDLIVLDTPPDTHALDFLARPNVLAGFMDQKVIGWLLKPFAVASRFGLGKLVNASEKLMGGIAKVTGVGALHKLADFLVLLQEVLEGFNRSGEKVVNLLRDPRTGFILVTVPTNAAARAARNIARELSTLGYRLDLTLLNRCTPEDSGAPADDAMLAGMPQSEEAAHARRMRSEKLAEERLLGHLANDGARATGGMATMRLPELQEGVSIDTPEGLAIVASRLVSAKL